jgi:hypothetical protein
MVKILADKLALPADEIARIAGELGDGVWDLAWSVASVTDLSVLESLRESLVTIMQEGGTLRDWLSMLDDLGWRSPLGAGHEKTIFNTTLGTVMEGERYDLLAGNPNVEFLVWDAIDDDRVDEECLALDGQTWPRDEFPPELWTPIHYNSFRPETAVSGSFVAGTRMLYAGKVIELETARGNHLAVTPNHPIATPSGFVAACELNKGSKVLAHCVGAEKVRAAKGPRPTPETRDDQHEPARIDEVFGALVEIFGMRTADIVSGDFHGDAERGNGHVDIAGSEGVLRDRVAGKVGGDCKHLRLEPSNVSDVSSTSPGDVRLDRIGTPGTPAGGPHSGEASGNMAGVTSTPPYRRVGATARLDAALQELAAEGVTADAGLFRELLERYPALVALDEVIDVCEVDWSGHVYDLQSTTGLIIAAGLVCSNCRCTVIPADADELDKLGATMHEGPPPLDHIAPGFDAPPSVNGLTAEVQQGLLDQILQAGLSVNPRLAPPDEGRAA